MAPTILLQSSACHHDRHKAHPARQPRWKNRQETELRQNRDDTLIHPDLLAAYPALSPRQREVVGHVGDSGVHFCVDYIKASGAIGKYYPDFVVVQETTDGAVNWIIETKGRVYAGTERKDRAVQQWCERVSEQREHAWRYARVNQIEFQKRRPQRLSEAVTADTLL